MEGLLPLVLAAVPGILVGAYALARTYVKNDGKDDWKDDLFDMFDDVAERVADLELGADDKVADTANDEPAE